MKADELALLRLIGTVLLNTKRLPSERDPVLDQALEDLKRTLVKLDTPSDPR